MHKELTDFISKESSLVIKVIADYVITAGCLYLVEYVWIKFSMLLREHDDAFFWLLFFFILSVRAGNL